MVNALSANSKRLPHDPRDGTLLGLLTATLYGLFTLLPGNSTLMVVWPWVFLWQMALMLPILWLLWQVWQKPLHQFALGHGLDWVAALTLLGLGVSTALAEFPAQARWSAWAAMGGIAAVYALSGWLRDAARCAAILRFQGYLALAFMVVSLGLWITQIYWPELARLQALQQYGVEAVFSFQFTSLRNWQPIGHQNYVAGYLVLVLPLLVGLGLVERGWHRWLWVGGIGLGLVNLYTTSSRAGWLALLATSLISLGVALAYSPLPRRMVLAAGGGAITLITLGIFTNSRLRLVLSHLAQGNIAGGELSYRAVTNAVGWHMGLSHPWTGVGPGSVPLVYQRYRPHWAGREAELQFQLHSTPAQLWGELGLWGILIPLALGATIIGLVARWAGRGAQTTPSGLSPVLVWGMLAGLFGFGLVSITDYQLDILAIGGGLGIYLVVIAKTLQPLADFAPVSLTTQGNFPARLNRLLAGLGVGLTLATALWLAPIHRAWAMSSQGFAALAKTDINSFAQALSQAHNLAPWEPYYPYQLGWNLGDLSYQAGDNPQLRQTLLKDAVTWFEIGNQIGPYQEFGQSNLGWLHLETQQPDLAQQDFIRAIELVSAKPGVFFGLGFSCLQREKQDCAVAAMGLELIRHPDLLTSPIWRIGQFADLYPAVLERLEAQYSTLLSTHGEAPALAGFLHQGRGALRWWMGDLAGAAEDWTRYGGPTHRALLALSNGERVEADTLPESPAKYAILAWQTPAQRQALLEKAWVTQPEDLPQLSDSLPPADTIQELVDSLNAATSVDDWLKRTAPSWQPRSGRLGFGVLSRHIDGPNPSDFYPRIENVPVVKFFAEIFASPIFMPTLDRALQPEQAELIASEKSGQRP